MNFKLDPGVKALLPKLTKEEYEGLERRILTDKHVDSLVIAVMEDTGERLLADGYNRFEICSIHKLQFPIREIKFINREHLYRWIVDNQLGRRNLTDEWRTYYLGAEYLADKAEHGGARVAGQSDSAAEKVAEKHKVSERTVRRAAEFAEAVDALPEADREKVLEGQSGYTRPEVIERGQQSEDYVYDEQLCHFCNRQRRLKIEPNRECGNCPKNLHKKSEGRLPGGHAIDGRRHAYDMVNWQQLTQDWGRIRAAAGILLENASAEANPTFQAYLRLVDETRAMFRTLYRQAVGKEMPE